MLRGVRNESALAHLVDNEDDMEALMASHDRVSGRHLLPIWTCMLPALPVVPGGHSERAR